MRQELAGRLDTTQPEISKLERRRDVRVSMMRAYVTGLGGSLHLSARFGDDEVPLAEPSDEQAGSDLRERMT